MQFSVPWLIIFHALDQVRRLYETFHEPFRKTLRQARIEEFAPAAGEVSGGAVHGDIDLMDEEEAEDDLLDDFVTSSSEAAHCGFISSRSGCDGISV